MVDLTSAAAANIGRQIFSMALAVTNMVGVPVGGFGVRFENLSEDTATQFFKVCANQAPVELQILTSTRSSSFCNSGMSSQ